MRKLQFLFMTILILACTNSEKISEDPGIEKLVGIAQKDVSLFDGTFIPKGTMAYQLNNQFRLEFPDGYQFVGSHVDASGNLYPSPVITNSIIVTCTCDQGTGGCSPWVQGENWGCTADANCTKCTGTKKDDPIQRMVGGKIISGDVIALNEPLEFIQPDEVHKYRSAFHEMFEVEEIYNELLITLNKITTLEDQEILASLAPNDPLPGNFSIVPLKFMGRIIMVNVNKSNSLAGRLNQVEAPSCACTAGDGCILDTMWTPKGKITFCDALECTTCTLTIEE